MESRPFRFRKYNRLLTSREFSSVFDQKTLRIGNAEFLFLAKQGFSQHSRLGMVVSKKNTRRSVDRSLIKRLIRESFRKRVLPVPLDIVVLTRPGIKNINKNAITESLHSIWYRLERKVSPSRG